MDEGGLLAARRMFCCLFFMMHCNEKLGNTMPTKPTAALVLEHFRCAAFHAHKESPLRQ
ncbi:hypothetical protein [uncultured Herbaspirillum sp.]|uniref:hypothetical protein n=1 Tax=uncultured Herbaspirillum sp. TaxID=160236 RepID=UPI002582F526|nr:hypothetical protein [uncultured Herbaspirillum sp.]